MSSLHLLSPRGFRAAGVFAGIKSRPRPDVGLLVCDVPAVAAAVFTTNKVFAAPVQVGRRHVAAGILRAVVVNSGNANACTGERGLADANQMCRLSAQLLACPVRQILPSSTGIIGHPLPMQKITRGIRMVAGRLGDSARHAREFADSILTTDLTRKTAATQFRLGRQSVRLAGVCKGSGMIGPRMSLSPGGAAPHATLLAYLTCDAKISPPLLRRLLQEATDDSFNAVTVDDHTSTNDTACILCSGLAEAAVNSRAATASFAAALREVCQSLAYQIAQDGEGATKVVKITVSSATTLSAARAMARAIANSMLVKCAMHGSDPNWGRIVSAAGLAGVPFNPNKAELDLQGTTVFRHGQPARFDAAALSRRLHKPDVSIDLACNIGRHSATCWTCDLSRQYVAINADYHT